jgi:signal transduction histidine kinase
LTQALLAFSRKQILNVRSVNLNEIVRRLDGMLGMIMGEEIEVRTRLADGDLMIVADSGQLEQVFMNLATNARDAMPHGGILTIETETLIVDDKNIPIPIESGLGRYAVVSYSDTGVGMDEKMRERIFEPFFTSKEVGKGTGLGLSVAFGIIKQHNGTILVSSEPGKGTTFKIYLPLSDQPPAKETQ